MKNKERISEYLKERKELHTKYGLALNIPDGICDFMDCRNDDGSIKLEDFVSPINSLEAHKCWPNNLRLKWLEEEWVNEK